MTTEQITRDVFLAYASAGFGVGAFISLLRNAYRRIYGGIVRGVVSAMRL